MDKTRILFICLGNICRSPAANAIMQKYVDETGLTDKFYIDSAGIGPWHIGQLSDKRMRQHGARRGYNINHIARQFNAKHDFDDFDYIIVMDDENYKNICWQAHNDTERSKVIRMADYLIKYKGRHGSCPKDTDGCARQCSSKLDFALTCTSVPDPYYGGDADFELSLNLIEDGCHGILDSITNKSIDI